MKILSIRNKIAWLLMLLPVVFSCVNTQKAVYFNNIQDDTLRVATANLEPVVQKGDLLSISVSSLNPEATAIFNLPNTSSGLNNNSTTIQVAGYLVNQEGNVQFPILGNIRAAGLSKSALKDVISRELVQRKLLVDPVVSVRYLNFRVTVLGEVARPTVVSVPSERITVLEALGMAGDLTVFGRRDNVLLIRETEGERIVKRLDLNSGNLLTSPYFYLRSNDVLYVEPNKAKINSGTQSRQILPLVLSGLSFMAIIIDRIIVN